MKFILSKNSNPKYPINILLREEEIMPGIYWIYLLKMKLTMDSKKIGKRKQLKKEEEKDQIKKKDED